MAHGAWLLLRASVRKVVFTSSCLPVNNFPLVGVMIEMNRRLTECLDWLLALESGLTATRQFVLFFILEVWGLR
jgi:hypothetical protein